MYGLHFERKHDNLYKFFFSLKSNIEAIITNVMNYFKGEKFL